MLRKTRNQNWNLANFDTGRPLWALLGLILIGLAGLLWLARPAAGSTPPPTAANDPAAAASCSANPFSSGYDLFGEGEIFTGFTNFDASSQNQLTNFVLDRLPDSGDILAEQDLHTETSQPWGFNVQAQAVTAADLDGNGHTEFIQSFVTTNPTLPGYYVAKFDADHQLSSYKLSIDSFKLPAAATGNLLGGDNEREQVVLAAVNDTTDSLTIQLWDGKTIGQFADPLAFFQSQTGIRGNPAALDVAVGNIDGDEKDDIVISLLDAAGDTIELLVLTYDPTYSSAGGGSAASKLRLLDTHLLEAGRFRDAQIALFRLDGDFRDEIALGAGSYQIATPDVSPEIRLFVFAFDTVLGELERLDDLDATIPAHARNFALGGGSISGQTVGESGYSPEEIVVGFDSTASYPFGAGFAIEVWRAAGLNTAAPDLIRRERWITNAAGHDRAKYLSLTMADLDNDGLEEIVTARDDGSNLQVAYLTNADLLTDPPDIPQAQRVDLDPAGLNGPTAVAVGDRDNDAIKAVYTAECRALTEQRVTSVTFAPPHWGIIQEASVKFAVIGRTQASETITSTALTYYRGDTVSGYIGAAVGGGLALANLEASARLHGAESRERSSTSGQSSGSGEALLVQRVGNEDFLTFENTDYNCYAYTLSQNGANLPEATLRNCAYVASSRLATDLNAWDNTWGAAPAGANQALAWTPVARDWASLALFRGAFTAQSSTFGDHAPGRAVDGLLQSSPANGSVATTQSENNPWWQIDLGEVQPISKVRLWNRTDWLNCSDLSSCPNQLDHIVVMISPHDFRTMPEEGSPAALMARSDVHTASLDDLSAALPGLSAADPLGKVTTFLTLDGSSPVQGRFVRIQRLQPNAQLSLGEVQIFGTNQVNPDRYPVNVREKGAADDGLFEVQLHNPLGTTPATTWPWVEVRGNLLWNRTGYNTGALAGDTITLGNAGINWTYSSYSQTGALAATSLTHETRMGVEFDYTAGVIFQKQVGYGQEFNTGTTAEHTTETSWSESIEFGGRVDGFPAAYQGQSWVLGCGYEIRPYYYELIETSTFGQESRYPVLDYIVPDQNVQGMDGENSSAGLDRLDAAATASCTNGNESGATPQAANDEQKMGAGASLTFDVLANDVGNQLTITGVSQPQHGQAAVAGRRITYTPNPGFVGTDTFTYTISDGAMTSQGTITVEVTLRTLFLPAVRR